MNNVIPTRETAKNPLMKELVEMSPDIQHVAASQREEEEEECLKNVQTIIECAKKLKLPMMEKERETKQWRMKDEGRIDSGIVVTIDSLHLKRQQVLHYNLRKKRRICRLLHDIEMEMSLAVDEVSREQELEEEVRQFEEEEQQLQEMQQLEVQEAQVQEAQVQEAQMQEGQGDTSV